MRLMCKWKAHTCPVVSYVSHHCFHVMCSIYCPSVDVVVSYSADNLVKFWSLYGNSLGALRQGSTEFVDSDNQYKVQCPGFNMGERMNSAIRKIVPDMNVKVLFSK